MVTTQGHMLKGDNAGAHLLPSHDRKSLNKDLRGRTISFYFFMKAADLISFVSLSWNKRVDQESQSRVVRSPYLHKVIGKTARQLASVI